MYHEGIQRCLRRGLGQSVSICVNLDALVEAVADCGSFNNYPSFLYYKEGSRSTETALLLPFIYGYRIGGVRSAAQRVFSHWVQGVSKGVSKMVLTFRERIFQLPSTLTKVRR